VRCAGRRRGVCERGCRDWRPLAPLAGARGAAASAAGVTPLAPALRAAAECCRLEPSPQPPERPRATRSVAAKRGVPWPIAARFLSRCDQHCLGALWRQSPTRARPYDARGVADVARRSSSHSSKRRLRIASGARRGMLSTLNSYSVHSEAGDWTLDAQNRAGSVCKSRFLCGALSSPETSKHQERGLRDSQEASKAQK
jgi:hypothetical protein